MTNTDQLASDSHRPKSPVLSKERSTTIIQDDTFRWRESAFDSKSSVRSKGIPPKVFHGNRRHRPGEQSVRNLHNTIQQSILKEEKRKVVQDSEIKRSAFKQLTSLRTWPLQSRAFQHWKELMDEYMHDGGKWNAGTCTNEEWNSGQDTQVSDSSDKSAGSQSTTTSSDISNQEPKRILRDTALSPAKSMLKNQYRNEFEQERNLSAPLSPDYDFGSSLWSMEPRIFSCEKSDKGKRKYIVGHLGRFMDLYWRKVDPQHRFYYELIRDNTPCRLYLDLEFSKSANPDITNEIAELLLDELFLEIQHELKEQFGISNINRSNVVDLESSTATKFSRHWIFHLPDQQLFVHTGAIGHFMQQLVSRIANDQVTDNLKERGRPLLQKYFLVNAAPSKSNKEEESHSLKKTCFIDCGVYTRNRLFRILGSQKFGKPPSAALRIASKNTFPFPKGFSNSLFYLPTMHQKTDQNLNKVNDTSDEAIDQIENAVEEFVAAIDWNSHAEALAQTFVVPLNWAKVSYPILPFDTSVLEESGKSYVRNSNSQRVHSSSMNLSIGLSPYPSIDDFVVNHLGRRGGIQGSIRAWSITEVPSTQTQGNATVPAYITYQMSRNRWCECIGRAHRSNNIQWTVDLRLWHCVQSCHDPECRALGFRGVPVPLPQSIREEVADQIFEEQLLRLDEETLIAQARSMNEITTSQSLQIALSSLSIHDKTDEKENEAKNITLSQRDDEILLQEQVVCFKETESDHNENKANETNLLSPLHQTDEDRFEAELLRLEEEAMISKLQNTSSPDVQSVTTLIHEVDYDNEKKYQNPLPCQSKTSQTITTQPKPNTATDPDSSDDDIDLVAFLSK